VKTPKVTLDELRTLRPVWYQPESIRLEDTVNRFAYMGVHGVNPADLPTSELMAVLGGAFLVAPSDPDDMVAFANAVAREYSSRVKRSQASAPAALAWLERNSDIMKAYLVARLFCPRGKRLAQMYCLPKDAALVRDSDGCRLLIKPTGRGRLAAMAGSSKRTRSTGVAWWYMSDDDVWDLRCKCCPRPDGGVRARDFLIVDGGRGYSVVLS
jgi:hypothetical protein